MPAARRFLCGAIVTIVAVAGMVYPGAFRAEAAADDQQLSTLANRTRVAAEASTDTTTYFAWPEENRGIGIARAGASGAGTIAYVNSPNGGLLWGRPHIAASGSHVYVVWNQGALSPRGDYEVPEVWLAKSSDGGSSWQTSLLSGGQLDRSDGYHSWNPRVTAAGDSFAVVWADLFGCPPDGNGCLRIVASTFGGDAAPRRLSGANPSLGASDYSGNPPYDVALQGRTLQLAWISGSSVMLTTAPALGTEEQSSRVVGLAGSDTEVETVGSSLLQWWQDGADSVVTASPDGGRSFAAPNRITDARQLDVDSGHGFVHAAWRSAAGIVEASLDPATGATSGGTPAAPMQGAMDPSITSTPKGVVVAWWTYTAREGSFCEHDCVDGYYAFRPRSDSAFQETFALNDRPAWGVLPVAGSDSGGYNIAWMHESSPANALTTCCRMRLHRGAVPDRDLTLVESEVVQAPFGFDKLVAGKPAVVRVEVINGFRGQAVPIKLIYDNGAGPVEQDFTIVLPPRPHTVFLPLGDPIVPQAGTFTYEVVLDPDGKIAEKNEANNTGTRTYPVKETRPFRALFVPIEITGDPSIDPISCAELRAMSAGSRQYIAAAFPVDPTEVHFVPDCSSPIKVAARAMDDLAIKQEVIEPAAARNTDGFYDEVVGVMPPGWLAAYTTKYQNAVGLAWGAYRDDGAAETVGDWINKDGLRVVLADKRGIGGWEVAHEISHNYGWVYRTHPLHDATQDHHLPQVDAPGYWVEQRYEMSGVSDWMYNSSAGADIASPLDRWLTKETYGHFFELLAADPQDPPLLSIRGTIFKDGTADMGPIWSLDGFLDRELGDDDGLFTLRYLDGAGTELGRTAIDGFDVLNSAGPGAHGNEVAPFWVVDAKVPDVAAARKLELSKDGVPVYVTQRSAAVPEIDVTGPQGRVALFSPVDVTWTSSDADGDLLTHHVAFSKDGGATWQPLAGDVQGSSLRITPTREMETDEGLFRVTTTDGWNTTSDVSGPVVVGVPPVAGKIAFDTLRGGGLMTIDPDGTNELRITTGAHPAWSPDGTQIAFVAEENLQPNIYIANADGTNVRKVTDNSDREEGPAWSPDGTKLVYVGGVDRLAPVLWTINVDGTGATQVTFGGDGRYPDWAPDGERIIYSRTRTTGTATPDGGCCIWKSAGLYTIKPDGTDERDLGLYGGQDPSWSPDGSQIVYRRFCDCSTRHDIWIANANGSAATALVTSVPDAGATSNSTQSDEYEPDWSPDGSRVVFAGRSRDQFGIDSTLIWMVDRDGANLTRVTQNTDNRNTRQDHNPSWGAQRATGGDPIEEPRFVVNAGGPYTGSEGETITLAASASGEPQGSVYGWDLDADGTYDDASGASTGISFPDDGEFPVGVIVAAPDGRVATDHVTVVVANAPPELGSGSGTVDASGRAELSVPVSDPGAGDTLQASIAWSDGATTSGTVVSTDDGYRVVGSHEYPAATSDPLASVTVADGDGGSDEAGVPLVSLSANSAPVARDASARGLQDRHLEVVLDASDEDARPMPLTFSVVSAPANGIVVFQSPSGAATATYFPKPGFSGSDSFTYAASDGEAFSAPASVAIDIAPDSNQTPSATPTTTATPSTAPTAPDSTLSPTQTSTPGPSPTPPPLPTATAASTPTPAPQSTPGSSSTPGPQPSETPAPRPTTTAPPKPSPAGDGRCTVVGTPGPDVLRGTRNADYICGRGGDDVLIGRGGGDRLLGGRGRDRLRGGPGIDVLNGGRGRDLLRGGSGPDWLYGGAGRDALRGGAGRDVLRGGDDPDRYDGGARRDRCFGRRVEVYKSCERRH